VTADGDDGTDIEPAHPAATVMLVRDAVASGGAGLEVFMLRRTTEAAFGAGMYVFPGGRVDEADGGSHIEAWCTGLDDEHASSALGVERGGLAYWVAAVRECFEEAGLLLARRRDGAAVALPLADRRAVHAGQLSMEELCRRHDLVLDLGAISYVSHWVTPRRAGRRFDTRFFVARTPQDQAGAHDESETVESRWVHPSDAIAMATAGTLVMMPPTIANLRFLEPWTTADEALAAAAAIERPRRIEPILRYDSTGHVIGVDIPSR